MVTAVPTQSAATPESKSLISRPLGQLVIALTVGAGIMTITALLLVGATLPSISLAAAGYLLGATVAVAWMRRGFPHPSLGVGNVFTVGRMALVAALLAPLVAPSRHWPLIVVAVIALSLDGVDGWFARRQGRVSDFGARLDVEVDSAIALILALNVFASGNAGIWIVLLGLPRYLFVAAGLVWPWLSQDLPESLWRKIICVVQVIALIVLQLPFVSGWPTVTVAAVVGGLLVWSFGRDIVWLWRSRR